MKFITLLAVLACVLQAQQRKPFIVPRISEPIRLDGIPNESAWQSIPPVPLTQIYPAHRGPFTERREIRIAYDDRYIYAAAWCYDSRPSQIRASSPERSAHRHPCRGGGKK